MFSRGINGRMTKHISYPIYIPGFVVQIGGIRRSELMRTDLRLQRSCYGSILLDQFFYGTLFRKMGAKTSETIVISLIRVSIFNRSSRYSPIAVATSGGK